MKVYLLWENYKGVGALCDIFASAKAAQKDADIMNEKEAKIRTLGYPGYRSYFSVEEKEVHE